MNSTKTPESQISKAHHDLWPTDGQREGVWSQYNDEYNRVEGST